MVHGGLKAIPSTAGCGWLQRWGGLRRPAAAPSPAAAMPATVAGMPAAATFARALVLLLPLLPLLLLLLLLPGMVL